MASQRTRKQVRRTFFFGVVVGTLALVTSACRPLRAARPLQRCEDRCQREVSACDEEACARGCRTLVDREVEGVAPAVFRCVSEAKECSERAFARCAVRQGIHADGGPPVPPPVPDDD